MSIAGSMLITKFSARTTSVRLDRKALRIRQLHIVSTVMHQAKKKTILEYQTTFQRFSLFLLHETKTLY
jgi:hypothetical protein